MSKAPGKPLIDEDLLLGRNDLMFSIHCMAVDLTASDANVVNFEWSYFVRLGESSDASWVNPFEGFYTGAFDLMLQLGDLFWSQVVLRLRAHGFVWSIASTVLQVGWSSVLPGCCRTGFMLTGGRNTATCVRLRTQGVRWSAHFGFSWSWAGSNLFSLKCLSKGVQHGLVVWIRSI